MVLMALSVAWNQQRKKKKKKNSEAEYMSIQTFKMETGREKTI